MPSESTSCSVHYICTHLAVIDRTLLIISRIILSRKAAQTWTAMAFLPLSKIAETSNFDQLLSTLHPDVVHTAVVPNDFRVINSGPFGKFEVVWIKPVYVTF